MIPKIVAMYLPQFHQIPENDEFWGKGFTDWVTVKKAKPLFEGHQQPRVPFNNNYYDLSIKKNVEWQSNLAHDHGIYGFGVYHYWFNNEKNLLTKPAEIMRDDDKIQTKYFFIWDNGNWKRSWSNVSGNDWAPIADDSAERKGPQILIPYILGKEPDWEKHFCYCLSHFKSDRYILKDNKPVFCIFSYSKAVYKMCKYWNELAKQNGFSGIHFIFQNPRTSILPKGTARYNYEPHSSGWWTPISFWGQMSVYWHLLFPKSKQNHNIIFYDFDDLWKNLIFRVENQNDKNYYPGAFVGYDDTPRRGDNNARVVKGATPEKFEKYFCELLKVANKADKEFIFLTAWNEWGEGAYMEPDMIYGEKYLEALKRSVEKMK